MYGEFFILKHNVRIEQPNLYKFILLIVLFISLLTVSQSLSIIFSKYLNDSMFSGNHERILLNFSITVPSYLLQC